MPGKRDAINGDVDRAQLCQVHQLQGQTPEPADSVCVTSAQLSGRQAVQHLGQWRGAEPNARTLSVLADDLESPRHSAGRLVYANAGRRIDPNGFGYARILLKTNLDSYDPAIGQLWDDGAER